MDYDEDQNFVKKLQRLPCPKNKKDYDYMQFARLIPKVTLNELEKNNIVTSAFTEEIRKNFPEVHELMVDIFYEPEVFEEEK